MQIDFKKTSSKWRRYLSPQNLAVYVFAVLAFSISWSTARVIQKNYGIQKEISALSQENEIRELENQKLKYQINYYKSDAYLEVEARRKFNKATAGENLLVFPRPSNDGSEQNEDLSELTERAKKNEQSESGSWMDNMRAWRDFLLFNPGGR